MKKFISAALAVVMAATSTVALAGSAEARHRDRHYGYNNYHYNHNYYRRHHHHNNDAVAAGILGLALGAIIVGTAQNNYARRNTYVRRDYYAGDGYARDARWEHIRRCEARYRSYDRRTDTFIGRDGREYYCNL